MKKIKNLFLMLVFFIIGHKSISQYSFNIFSNPYQALDTSLATNLTKDFVWNFGTDTVFTVPIGFDFYINEEKYDSIRVNIVDGVISFYQKCNEPENTSSGPELLAFLTGLTDRGMYSGNFDTAYSPVSHITNGNEGNRIFKLEWKDAGFNGGDWDDSVNFQIWLYETSNNIEIRFGTSNIQDTTDVWTYHPDGPIVEFSYDVICNPMEAKKAIWIYGYRNNPDFITLDDENPSPPQANISGVPDSGIVYQFSPWKTGIENYADNIFESIIYPNPTTGKFTFQIKHDELPMMNISPDSYRVKIYNLLGEKVYTSLFNIQHSAFNIDISPQPSGIYFYQISSGEKMYSGKLVKE